MAAWMADRTMNAIGVVPGQFLPAFCWVAAGFLFLPGSLLQAGDPSSGFTGSSSCAECHSRVYQSYMATPMARSSGQLNNDNFVESFAKSEFVHPRSGVNYRVWRGANGTYFEFSRPAALGDRFPIQGKRQMDYFVGSGAAGRSYLSTMGGFLFQAPVSYYSRLSKWDISPGFQRSETLNLTRPIEAECLQCHASQLQAVPGTQNGYRDPAFLESGVGCERCHGPGKNHVERMRAGQPHEARSIVNPAKLEANRRDSVCAQCHLAGEVRIAKPGKSLAEFRPGDLLSDYAISFVWETAAAPGLTVTSHYERLWQSQCKKASGDRLWCGSCHDPHSLPSKTILQDYFRQKCLACHRSADCGSNSRLRLATGNDCIACHMPKSETVDVGHVVYTDHSIPRIARARSDADRNQQNQALVAFGGATSSPRDLGLAYAKLAIRDSKQTYFAGAFDLLKQAAGEKSGDAELLLHLGYVYDQAGNEDKAMPLYKGAIQLDPTKLEAAINLGSILTVRGRHSDAIQVWEDALTRNPGLDPARINLALAHLRLGDRTSAERALRKALEYQPDLPVAQKLLSDVLRLAGN